MTWNTDRGQYIAGLRRLADLLETHDDLLVPTHGEVDWLLFSDDDYEAQKSTAAVIVRRLGGAKKQPDKLFRFKTTLGGPDGLGVEIVVDREAVCERVVTGTREVTEMVPDPSIDVPLVEQTKTVEDVEWRCAPLLEEPAAAS